MIGPGLALFLCGFSAAFDIAMGFFANRDLDVASFWSSLLLMPEHQPLAMSVCTYMYLPT